VALLSLVVCFVGCALRDVLPGPPVAVGPARAAFDASLPPRTAAGEPIVYTGPPVTPFPVLPLQIWGLRYALDLVLVSDHPDWVMHEYARIDLPEGPLWLAKDAGRDREQTIVADIPDLERWVPEAPVRRMRGGLSVEEAHGNGITELHLGYTNPLGQGVTVDYRGAPPANPSNPRNGNTMGHSRRAVAALLDLYRFRIGGEAHIRIDGVERGLHRLAGLLPEVYLLASVQGGFAVADFCQTAADHGFGLRRPCVAPDWPTRSDEAWTGAADGWVERTGGPTSLRYHFVEGELDRAVALQAGAEEPLVVVSFSPRLPDVRRPFRGESHSGFVVDVNGQPGHGTGCVRTRGEPDGSVRVELVPTAPRWFADRPMAGTVRVGPEGAVVTTARVEALAGCGPGGA
jgi:hypothetical protein